MSLLAILLALSQLPFGSIPRQLEEIAAIIDSGGTLEALIEPAHNYVSDPSEPIDQKLRALSLLLNAHQMESPSDAHAKIDELLSCVELESSQYSPKVQFLTGTLRIRYLYNSGEYERAAESGMALMGQWEGKVSTEMTLNTMKRVSESFYRAGLKGRALDYVENIWITHPNSYMPNEAVRAGLADLARDRQEPDLAFELLNELRQSFQIEFEGNPYTVQNYLDYGSQAKHSSDPLKQTRALQELAAYGEKVLAEVELGKLRSAAAFSLAKIYHRLLDKENALRLYKLAASTAPDTDMGKSIIAWSNDKIDRIETGDLDDVIAMMYGEEFGEMVEGAAETSDGVGEISELLETELGAISERAERRGAAREDDSGSLASSAKESRPSLHYTLIGLLAACVLLIIAVLIVRKGTPGGQHQ